MSAEAGDLKAIMKKFDDFSLGELNETYERYVFNNRSQKDRESMIESFAIVCKSFEEFGQNMWILRLFT